MNAMDWYRRERDRLGLPLGDDDLGVIAKYVEEDTRRLAAGRVDSESALEPPLTLLLPMHDAVTD